MSLSFACPGCKAKMEVSEELAGHSGQCPRCEHVFMIPVPAQLASPGKASPAAPTKVPPADPWAEPSKRAEDRPQPKPAPVRRAKLVPKPGAPIWSWALGLLAALVVFAMLVSSATVLAIYRKPSAARQPVNIVAGPAVDQVLGNPRITAGRLEGRRAILQNGVFQAKSELNHNDAIDPQDPTCRCKQFEVELIANRAYWIEMDADRFDSLVRVERFGNSLRESGQPGIRNAQILYTPPQTQIYTILTTCVDPGTGPFTITVREQGTIKPFVP